MQELPSLCRNLYVDEKGTKASSKRLSENVLELCLLSKLRNFAQNPLPIYLRKLFSDCAGHVSAKDSLQIHLPPPL